MTDHIKEAAHGINIRVVSIVGGMSTEKQERLLKARPEIIVGTPGRLWELMSGGEKHLVEVSDCMRYINWMYSGRVCLSSARISLTFFIIIDLVLGSLHIDF